MSGRAYARDAQGFLGGGADLASIVPHTFRIASPKRSLSARELGIRRVIRRRCMEKNWKKLISRRHVRERQETQETEAEDASESPAPVHDPDSSTRATGAAPCEHDTTATNSSATDSTAAAPSTATIVSATVQPSVENGTRKPKTETAPDSETVGLAKRQLEELEAKLQTLVDEKHAKFVQLKSILVEEARSKSSTPTPADATAAAKKRRVEFKDSAAAAASLLDASAAAAPGSPAQAAAGVTTAAPAPSAAPGGSTASSSGTTPGES